MLNFKLKYSLFSLLYYKSSTMTKRKARKILKKLAIPATVMCLLILLVVFISYKRLQQSVPAITPQDGNLQYSHGTTTSLAWPSVGQAAIGASDYGVLSTYGNQIPVPTASIAKLITALAVLRVKPIASGSQGSVITLSQNDVNFYNNYSTEGGSVAVVTAGEQITEYQLLEGMLLPSANNMADSLAVWAFGSLSAYDSYASHMVTTLGLTNTHIGTDASGFLPSTTSTANDLVSLGIQAEANPIIASIVSQRSANLPVAGTVNNVNWLVGSYGVDGIKTGNSNQDKGVYLFSDRYPVAPNHIITIVGAIMDGQSLQKAIDDGAALLLSSQKAFAFTAIVQAGQTIGYYNVPWGKSVTAVTRQAVQSITWQGIPLNHPNISLDNVHAPQKTDTVVGTMRYTQGNTIISSSPIILKSDIDTPSRIWRVLRS
jgi:D-alanyl-D-alanine carboxypeptidase (penicillin-binding protein 5/6)